MGEGDETIIWDIERRLAEDAGGPIIFHPRQVICDYKRVKGIDCTNRFSRALPHSKMPSDGDQSAAKIAAIL